jgi:hypothetical protein
VDQLCCDLVGACSGCKFFTSTLEERAEELLRLLWDVNGLKIAMATRISDLKESYRLRCATSWKNLTITPNKKLHIRFNFGLPLSHRADDWKPVPDSC